VGWGQSGSGLAAEVLKFCLNSLTPFSPLCPSLQVQILLAVVEHIPDMVRGMHAEVGGGGNGFLPRPTECCCRLRECSRPSPCVRCPHPCSLSSPGPHPHGSPSPHQQHGAYGRAHACTRCLGGDAPIHQPPVLHRQRGRGGGGDPPCRTRPGLWGRLPGDATPCSCAQREGGRPRPRLENRVAVRQLGWGMKRWKGSPMAPGPCRL
jgi:hypothetical protein